MQDVMRAESKDIRARQLAMALYVLINVLFVDKYSARMTEWHAIVSCIYAICAGGALWLLDRVIEKIQKPILWLGIIAGLWLGVGVAIQYAIDPITLQVDRWSAIHHFLDGMLAGVYPYGQQTHLGGYGSPLPVWQILHLPFYAIGNVGLSILVVLGGLLYTLVKTRGAKQALIVCMLLGAAPACWYEIAVRSDLITNIMLVAILVEWLKYKQIELAKNTISIGVLCGLVLSTRLVAVIPLAVAYGYEFIKMGWKKQIVFVLIVASSFAVTLLPFILWEGSTLLWFEYNPFVLQTRQGSITVMILWAVLAIGWAIYTKGEKRMRVISTGLILTTLVVMAFVGKMWTENAWKELYSSTFDITYLSLALPFYTIAISERKY